MVDSAKGGGQRVRFRSFSGAMLGRGSCRCTVLYQMKFWMLENFKGINTRIIFLAFWMLQIRSRHKGSSLYIGTMFSIINICKGVVCIVILHHWSCSFRR